MANPAVSETVIVDFKYEKNNSFKATNGKWYAVSDYAKDSAGDKLGLNDFEKGKQYDVAVQTGPKGGKYIVSAVILASATAETFDKNMGVPESKPEKFIYETLNKNAEMPEVKAKTKTDWKAAKPASEVTTKAEWVEKDNRISAQGLYQAALQAAASSGAATTFEELHDLAWGDAMQAYKKLWGREFAPKGE